ncbi:MAG: Stp1/IreP family PP2C-type Ser/Thr phosphatase [Erysipelothrix sp.]|nr:Stp1/IreP family PP2C-type Ser/Thr phosphatase [Erysipelothrix sp.]
MIIAGKSDIGLVRVNNEDNYIIVNNQDDNTLMLVCDGIGGSKAGEIASLTAIKFMAHAFSHTTNFTTVISAKLWLEKNLRLANDEVALFAEQNLEYEGMGTTLVGAMIFNQYTIIINIGDSRAYILKDNTLKQVTQDHSLVNELLNNGQITSDEIDFHPQRNVLTNALGIASNVRIDLLEVNQYDTLLLCSDGLSGYVSESIIERILNQVGNVEVHLNQLIQVAHEAGGYDNITVILAERGGAYE